MAKLVDLSHALADGMPGFRMRGPDGKAIEYTARVRPFLTHADSAAFYQRKSSFEITELTLQTSVGTYLDAPCHRYPGRRDVAELALEELVLPGVCVDVTRRAPGEAIGPDALPPAARLRGRAALFRFGWDIHFGRGEYQEYPFLHTETIDALVAAGTRLVGVDTVNIDDKRDLARPAHTRRLAREILVVENLRGLEKLPAEGFRFFAVPVKVRGGAAMPVRAFAELGVDPPNINGRD